MKRPPIIDAEYEIVSTTQRGPTAFQEWLGFHWIAKLVSFGVFLAIMLPVLFVANILGDAVSDLIGRLLQ